MPKISVIMPVYNGAAYLRAAIDSILGQTAGDFEFIIINDGSTDKTTEILGSYSDTRLVIINQANQGVTKSLNTGLKIAQGEFIARMDADDIALPERFHKQLAFFSANENIALCGSCAVAVDKDNNFLENFDYPPLTHGEIKKYFVFHNPFIHSSIMFRQSLIATVGTYNEKIPRAQDYEFWGRVILKFETANLPDRLIRYRVLEHGVTKSKNLSMRLIGLKIRLSYLVRLLKNC